jgi:hypothetical protein
MFPGVKRWTITLALADRLYALSGRFTGIEFDIRETLKLSEAS